MFEPKFCPRVDCPAHLNPTPDFYVEFGYYKPKCRPHFVPRFYCNRCLRTFSRQTFRADYRMKKPHLTQLFHQEMVSSTSLRQAARILKCSRRTIARLLVRMGRHSRNLLAKARSTLPFVGAYQYDELETYEGHRRMKPLTVGFLLQENTRFLVDVRVGQIRSRAAASKESKARRARFEEKHGKRPNESRKITTTCLNHLRRATDTSRLVITTDEKPLYRVVLNALYGTKRPAHVRVSSKLPRDGSNPLAPINQIDLLARHHVARLIRETVAASKQRDRLHDHLAMFVAWWNFVRRRTNEDRYSPAMAAGIVNRFAQFSELFGWRQDFRPQRLPILRRS